jgi:hypothetical protein
LCTFNTPLVVIFDMTSIKPGQYTPLVIISPRETTPLGDKIEPFTTSFPLVVMPPVDTIPLIVETRPLVVMSPHETIPLVVMIVPDAMTSAPLVVVMLLRDAIPLE